eukprot:COSAG02_NODE_3610_length_6484_cov_2.117269_8_plen_79_part_01
MCQITHFNLGTGACVVRIDAGSFSLFLRNRGDWRSNEPSGLGPGYRVVAQAATVALLQALSSQWLSFFVSTLDDLVRAA